MTESNMLLPTDRSAGLAATNLMQSMLDRAEERRAEQEEKARGSKEDPVLKARMSTDQARARARDKIDTYLFDAAHVSVNELKMQLMERLGTELGLRQEDGESGFGWGRRLETALSTMDYAARRALEKQIGLDELGISIDTLVAAIKNPYADDSEKLKAALELKAGGGSDTHVNQSRVLQRLEGIADTKSLEELALEPTLNDPTRIEDDQVRQERAEEISDKQAMEKLTDVRELQEAVGDARDSAGTAASGDAPAAALDAISVLAGIADLGNTGDEASDRDAEVLEATREATGTNGDAVVDARSDRIEAGLDPDGELPRPGDLLGLQQRVLPIHVDEIGLYALLDRKNAA